MVELVAIADYNIFYLHKLQNGQLELPSHKSQPL
jgi:hypothetical protein